jgi:prolipoprotein diacylglyceryl transferase
MAVPSTISFPGLGIEKGVNINPIAFTVFGKEIAWYGIIITSGVMLAWIYVMYRSKFEKVKEDDVMDMGIWVLICGIIGARLYYVIMKHENYHTFMDVIATWEGGLAIYGGIIGGGLAAVVVAKVKKLNPFKLLDMLGPAVFIGQIMGRWGNFTNAEAFGGTTDLPWRMGINNVYYPDTIYVHPTFLYESLWNLVGFLLLNWFYTKKKYNGQIILLYATWYGFGRMLIEGLRSDSLYIGAFKVSQLVGLISFVAGAILLIVFGIINKNKTKEVVE